MPRKEVKTMEKRKEYAEGETITCPRCGGDDLECEESPDQGKCFTCGPEFTIRQVAVWKE
jgi:DNA-directed RNA polymerase subunit RPC12/RpoP